MALHLLQPQATYSFTINMITPLIFTSFICLGLRVTVVADTIKIDIFTDNNSSTDAVVVADDTSGEIGKQSSGCGSSAACYKGRHAYNSANSDGGVIGPFSGTNYRIFVDLSLELQLIYIRYGKFGSEWH